LKVEFEGDGGDQVVGVPLDASVIHEGVAELQQEDNDEILKI
jgi:hypothetical protein